MPRRNNEVSERRKRWGQVMTEICDALQSVPRTCRQDRAVARSSEFGVRLAGHDVKSKPKNLKGLPWPQ